MYPANELRTFDLVLKRGAVYAITVWNIESPPTVEILAHTDTAGA
jgi:hypothetical protein